MGKFKAGDKVRVVKSRDDGSFTTKEFIGKEGVINQTGGYYGYHVQFANDVWAFYPDELEAADPTPEARLERAKALVAELKQKIEDAKPKVRDLPLGTVIDSGHDYYTKIARDSWVVVDKSRKDSFKRSNTIVVYRDERLSNQGFEVIREGI